MAAIVHREDSDTKLKEIDKSVKNKFRWNWLERCVTIPIRDNSGKITNKKFVLAEFIRKVDKPGLALCQSCDTLINYGTRGAKALEEHCEKTRHADKLSLKITNSTMFSFIEGKKDLPVADESYGIHPSVSASRPQNSTLQPLVPMCDRISNSEEVSCCMPKALILGVIAEHSMSLSMAPVLVSLAKSLAQDKAALNSLSIGRHSASYKMTHGVAKTFKDETVENLKRFPFSINIDESTANNNKRILSVLVSYLLPDEGIVRVDHLASLEVIKVDADSLFNAIDNLFLDMDIPWTNLVSVLMDSCNVMRGSKNGVEAKMRRKAEHLLDIDGDSCHHIHNSCKKFCALFDWWIEGLLGDLFSDFKWSSDLKEWLHEICDILHIKFTTPQRYVSHRWLSVYDVCISTNMLFDSYLVLYYGFIPDSLKSTYKDVMEAVLTERKVSPEGRERIRKIHQSLGIKWKTLTADGKSRKNRIIEKIYYKNKQTKLNLHFYIAALPLLQAYVKVFQSKDTLIHKLHDKQLETFQQFLVSFVKPEVIAGLSGQKLKELNLKEDNGQFLSVQVMFFGHEIDKIRKETRKDDSVFENFQKKAVTAYINCAVHMKEKLPLHNQLLRSLSCIDPLARGHAVTASQLKKLSSYMTHFLSEEQHTSLSHEVLRYQIDATLPDYQEGSDTIAMWWSKVSQTGRYPGLSKLAGAALSIFHGPQVESSFNLMGDIIDPKSSRMNSETFDAIQTVKYAFLSKKTSALRYFDRPDSKFTPVNRILCRNMRSAADKHKKLTLMRAEKRKTMQQRLHLNESKKDSRNKVKEATEKATEEARQKHLEKQAKASRKRALEQLVNKTSKKRKLIS